MSGHRSFEENTLGVVLGAARKGGRGGRRRSFTPDRPSRSIRPAAADDASLGTGYLGIGLMVAAAIVVAFGLLRFAFYYNHLPHQGWNLLAWFLLICALGGITLTARRYGRWLPHWAFALIVASLTAAAAIDLVAVHGLAAAGIYPTAAVACGAVLMGLVTLREARDILIATAVLGAGMLVSLAIESRTEVLTLGSDIATLALTVSPPLFGVAIVSAFRRMVQLELDRALVHSTVSSPKFAVGMLASRELARLDLNAERLLDDVASGNIALPLSPRFASTAASLATELRLHLIEGRRETWLHHAVTESEFLGPLVTVSDPDSYAGLLSSEQRDALLSAIWLLMNDSKRAGQSMKLTLGPVVRNQSNGLSLTITIPIVISTSGVARHRIDPATWEAVRKVGRYSETLRDESVHINIECTVDNPAD